jgi:hypothetical protein
VSFDLSVGGDSVPEGLGGGEGGEETMPPIPPNSVEIIPGDTNTLRCDAFLLCRAVHVVGVLPPTLASHSPLVNVRCFAHLCLLPSLAQHPGSAADPSSSCGTTVPVHVVSFAWDLARVRCLLACCTATAAQHSNHN